MKEIKTNFDFKFLNKVMYIGAIIGIFYFLKNLGIMDKIVDCLVSLMPVFLGLVICWISMPLTNKLKKLGLSKGMSAIISLIIIYGVLIAIFAIIIPVFAEQLTSLIKELPNLYDTAVNKINEFAKNNLGIEQEIDITSSLKNLDIVQQYLGKILNYSLNTLQSILNIIISIFTTIVVSFFMVKDMDKIKAGIITFFSRNKKGSNRYKMINEMDTTLTAYVKGMIIDSFLVGVLTTIVCLVLGIDYSILFGCLIFVLNLIPYIGALLSELIVAIYAFTIGGPVFAIITFVCLLLVQIIDANILQPNIVAKSVDLHPVVVLAGLTVSNLLMGMVGMIIAVPVIALIKIWLNYKFSAEISEFSTISEVDGIEEENKKTKSSSVDAKKSK
ncbi:putative uncharacterized protein [Clostridium sp. CAG:1219]|nr:putative uncharacterized protein [Clostridium sp. CAG:1219]